MDFWVLIFPNVVVFFCLVTLLFLCRIPKVELSKLAFSVGSSITFGVMSVTETLSMRDLLTDSMFSLLLGVKVFAMGFR